jgi:hypothetical protein
VQVQVTMVTKVINKHNTRTTALNGLKFLNVHCKIPKFKSCPLFFPVRFPIGRNLSSSVFSDVYVRYNPQLRAVYDMSGSQITC